MPQTLGEALGERFSCIWPQQRSGQAGLGGVAEPPAASFGGSGGCWVCRQRLRCGRAEWPLIASLWLGQSVSHHTGESTVLQGVEPGQPIVFSPGFPLLWGAREPGVITCLLTDMWDTALVI